MAKIKGTKGADELLGTRNADEIDGLDGNDRIDGGDGDDLIDGGAGDDVILGGEGNDRIYDRAGSDRIDAGAGNDNLYANHYTRSGAPETVTIAMGDGNDVTYFGNVNGGTAAIDLGTGNDSLWLYNGTSATTVTTGDGSDVFTFWFNYRPAATPLLVTDFAAGVGGDVLGLTWLFGEVLTGWKGMRNPFAGGYVRLVQDGTDTIVQYDADGQRHGDQFVTLARLANVDATMLAAENLAGFPPDGSAPEGLRVDDVSLTDPYAWFDGTISRDRIHGGDGFDRIDGGVGGDRIWGDAGDDQLSGDAGNDQLYGGDGNDIIRENGGSNLIDGGAGNDQVFFQEGMGTGGGGGDETILLGEGGDWGRYQNARSGSLTLDMGTGNDQFELYTVQDGGARITTGTGSDLITLGWDGQDHFRTGFEVTDFTAGSGGDRIEFSNWLRDAAPTWDGGNPFAEGFARLTEVEGATLVEIDRDGSDGPAGFVTLARLDGVAAATLIAVNLGGFDPHAAIAPVAGAGHAPLHAEGPHLYLA